MNLSQLLCDYVHIIWRRGEVEDCENLGICKGGYENIKGREVELLKMTQIRDWYEIRVLKINLKIIGSRKNITNII